MTENEVQNKNKFSVNPFDLDGQQFDPDLYMQKLLKVTVYVKCSLH